MHAKNLLIYGVVNLLMTTLSGAAGGGSALIGAPLLVLLGLSPVQAIATAKFSSFGISFGTSSRFFKEKITDKRTVFIFSILGVFGGLAGSLALVHFSNHTALIQKIMGLVILAVGIPLLYLRKAGLVTRARPTWLKAIGLLVLAVNVVFVAALGAGIGSLQMIVLIYFFGMTALVASATRRAMQLVVATVSLAVYIHAGFIDYKFGIVALLTSLVGGFVGAHIAIKKGNRFVINLFAIVSAILALQLLFGSTN